MLIHSFLEVMIKMLSSFAKYTLQRPGHVDYYELCEHLIYGPFIVEFGGALLDLSL